MITMRKTLLFSISLLTVLSCCWWLRRRNDPGPGRHSGPRRHFRPAATSAPAAPLLRQQPNPPPYQAGGSFDD